LQFVESVEFLDNKDERGHAFNVLNAIFPYCGLWSQSNDVSFFEIKPIKPALREFLSIPYPYPLSENFVQFDEYCRKRSFSATE
jgi:hypothetical protein